MKKRYQIFKGLLAAVFLFLLQGASAQVNISVQVLPPYLYRITDYASHPQQLLVTLTNTTTIEQRIQLRGAVTGDNGVEIRVKQSFKSRQPLVLAPGEVLALNGGDVAAFLDFNNLTFSGITSTEAVRGNGLPEGNYRMCVRAYNWDSNSPLSAEEPVGCSNTFGVTSLEPPRIITPNDGQNITSNGTQLVSFSWSTPPGAPPSVMYRIRMVEIVGNRNPNDAMISAPQPYFFEKEVMGNMYVYNPADPQLTPGRKYALIIEAYDPNNLIVFRNKGQSVVSSFTYTGSPVIAGNTGTVVTSNAPISAGANITLVGSVAWAFDASEAVDESTNTPLVSTKAVSAISRTITPSGKADKIQYPLTDATVYLYATYINTVTLFGTASCDRNGNYKIITRIAPAMLPRITNPYIEIKSASGLFNQYKKVIQLKITSGNFTVTSGTPDVLTAASMRIAANVVRPSLSNADQVTVNLLLSAAVWNKYSFYKNINASPEHTEYNGQDYVILTTLRSGDAYKKLFLNQGNISYVAQVNAFNKPSVYYPIQPVLLSNAALKPIVSIKRNFSYNLNNTLDGTVTFMSKGKSGVRITATVNPADVIGSISATPLETVTDYFGYYNISLPDLKNGAIVKLSIVDRSIQETPFTYETTYTGVTPLTKNIVLTRTLQSVVGRLVDNNNLPVPNALVTVNGTNISTKTTTDGLYYLTMVANNNTLDLQFSADGYNGASLSVNATKLGSLTTNGITAVQWQDKITSTATVKNWMMTKSVPSITATDLGLGTGDLNAAYQTLFADPSAIQRVADAGTATMANLKGVAQLNLKLNGKAVRAKITINNNPEQNIEASGTLIYRNDPGNYTFTITPYPGDAPFVQFYGEFNLIKGGLNNFDISLEDGIRLSGTVINKKTGKALDSVAVSVAGMPYKTTVDKSGLFVLYLPKNESFTYNFQRKDYYNLDTTARVAVSTTFNIGIDQVDLSFPKITTLAGYPVQLTKHIRTGADFTISGTLTIGSNALFTLDGGSQKLNFKDVTVKMGAKAGNAEPVTDINFEEAVLNTTMFGFAPVEVQGAPFLQLKAGASGNYSSGIIGGNQLVLKLSTSSIVSKLPVKLNDAVLKDAATTGNVAFNSAFSAPDASLASLSTERAFKIQFLESNYDYNTVVSFLTDASGATSYVESKLGTLSSLFIDKNLATLTKLGVSLNGYFQFPKDIAVKMAEDGKIKLEKFLLGPNFALGEIKLPVSDAKPLTANMQKVVLKLTKFELSGIGTPNVDVLMGGSIQLKKNKDDKDDDGVLTIKSLSIINRPDGHTLSGSFNLPKKGLSVKSLTFTTPNDKTVDMSYSSVDNGFTFETSGVLDYKSAGSDESSKSLLKSVFPVEIQKFQLKTKDWGVFMAVKPNLKVELDVLKMNIDHFLVNIGSGMTMDKMNAYLLDNKQPEVSPGSAGTMIDDAQASWAVGISGQVEFPMKGLKTEIAGSILLAGNDQGLAVRVNEISLKIDNPVFQLKSKVRMQFTAEKRGFEGEATVTTLKTDLGAAFLFYSYYESGAIELMAKVKATANIITGPVQWFAIGGEIYANTFNQVYSVMMVGDITATGTPKEVAYLKDLYIRVLFDLNNCGGAPVIEGSGSLMLQNKLWGSSYLTIDFCKNTLLAGLYGDAPLLKGVADVHIEGMLYGMAPSAANGKGSLFMSFNAEISMFSDMVKGNMYAALGVNMNFNNANTPDDIRDQAQYIPEPAKDNGNIFNGIYVDAWLRIPSGSNSFKWQIADLNILGLSYKYSGLGRMRVYYKFTNNNFYAAATVLAKAQCTLTVLNYKVTGKASANLEVTGGYDGKWFLTGKVGIAAQLYSNNSLSCNTIKLGTSSCCCFELPEPCCSDFFSSCFWDWSCRYTVCLPTLTFNFKACATINASFAYRQDAYTNISFTQ
ncbi:MAG: carboxypeptidase-like regulatory domain-containing protein [Bacteroidota bacterium]